MTGIWLCSAVNCCTLNRFSHFALDTFCIVSAFDDTAARWFILKWWQLVALWKRIVLCHGYRLVQTFTTLWWDLKASCCCWWSVVIFCSVSVLYNTTSCTVLTSDMCLCIVCGCDTWWIVMTVNWLIDWFLWWSCSNLLKEDLKPGYHNTSIIMCTCV